MYERDKQMGRKKLQLELIPKENERMLSFKKRKEGLTKKLEELKTLCGVNACMIIYGPNGEAEPEVYPDSLYNTCRVIHDYRLKKGDPTKCKTFGLSDFFQEKKRKAEEEFKKMRKENTNAKYPTWNAALDEVTDPLALRALADQLSMKSQIVKSRIEFLKSIKNQEMLLDNFHQFPLIDDDGLERSDLPIICESCVGDNPTVGMTKADYDKECKFCTRPFKVFTYNKCEICQTCSKLNNVCQVCLLDLEYGVRDTAALSINSNDAIPRSDVNGEYFAEEHDRRAIAGIDYESSFGKVWANDTIFELQRNRAHVCSFFIRGQCTRGPECPYRHEMPVEGELSQQNIKDCYYGVKDPVAMKLLNKAGEMPSLEPPDDESIRTLYVGGAVAAPPYFTSGDYLLPGPGLQPEPYVDFPMNQESQGIYFPMAEPSYYTMGEPYVDLPSMNINHENYYPMEEPLVDLPTVNENDESEYLLPFN